MTAGVTTPNLTPTALADSLVVNRGGSTYLQTLAALGAQLAASGPLAAALLAQAARIDQIEVDGDVYATTGAGLADTVIGAQFRVRSSDPDVAYRIYRHDAGPVATLILQAPSVASLAAKADASALAGVDSRVGDLEGAVSPGGPDTAVVRFTDADDKLLMTIKSNGVPDFEVDEPLRAKTARTQKSEITGVAYAVTDADDKLLFAAMQDGRLLRGDGQEIGVGGQIVDAGSVSAYDRGALPYLRGQTVTLKSLTTVAAAIQHSTTIYGRDTGSGRPSKVITNDSLTHPKILHIPGGWRGYSHWMAVTPYFGASYAEDSENPHILASNDGVSWSEIPAGPLDLAGEGTSYWSDTHLVLGDDGWLYCIYRGMSWPAVEGEPAGVRNYYQRSRDGVTWSGRTFFGTSGGTVSPVVMPSPRGGFDYFEVALSGSPDPFPDGKRQISRRWSPTPLAFPARHTADACVIQNRIWEAEMGAAYDIWHLDIDRIGNLWLGLFCVRPTSGGGPDVCYLGWSPDGWRWTILPGRVGASAGPAHYRSCVVPVAFGEGAAVADLYLAAGTTGVISVHRATLEIA